MVRLLGRLHDAGRVKLIVPQIAALEWASQRAESAYQEIRQAIKSLRSLEGRTWASSLGEEKAFAERIAEADSISYEELIGHFRTELTCLNFSVLKLKPTDTELALDGYFNGKPPYSAIKSRKDIPDGFIAAAVQRAIKEYGASIFVCRDKRLAESVSSETLDIRLSLEELLSHPEMKKLAADPEFALWWEEHFTALTETLVNQNDELVHDLAAWLSKEGLDTWVSQQTVYHHELPEDNRSAQIESSDTPENIRIDWFNAMSIGEGILAVPVVFDIDMTLAFMVYRGDAVEVPDWVNLSYSGFAEQKYLDAYANREGQLSATLIMNFGNRVRSPENEKALAARFGLDFQDVVFELEDIELLDFIDKPA